MKIVLIIALAFAIAAEAAREKRQIRASPFTYPAGSTAAYTPGTGLIYNSGTIVKYVAGTTLIFPYVTQVSFEGDSSFYAKEGPVNVLAGYNATFGSNAQITFGPGSRVKFITNYAEVRYQQFNGNSHTMVQYPNQTPAQYYCSNCNLILMGSSTNPLEYYNPGATTKFGVSAMPVEVETTPTARTYGYYGGGGGYSYCSGYSYNGWPQTTYYNYNTGYRSTCYQTGYNTYSYGGGGGGYSSGGGGGYSMAGGSCYGGGSYYGGGGGGGYGR